MEAINYHVTLYGNYFIFFLYRQKKILMLIAKIALLKEKGNIFFEYFIVKKW